MIKQKLTPIPKIDLTKISVGDTIEVHADRLAAFKSAVSRYNSTVTDKVAFNYGAFKNDYCTATAKIHPSLITRTS